jgi:hypothetical protein
MKSTFQAGKTLLLTITGWLLSASTLWAKEGSTSEGGGGETSWVMSYFIVLLAVVLGMLVVCRSSSRRDRVKPEAYSEGKTGQSHAEGK